MNKNNKRAIDKLKVGQKYLCIEAKTNRECFATCLGSGQLKFSDGAFVTLTEQSDVTFRGATIYFH